MRLTKLPHACVRISHADQTLVIDPGSFSDPAAALQGATAVAVTHEHADHLDPGAFRAALDADPDLHLWAPAAVAAEWGDRATTLAPGDAVTLAGMPVRAYGGQHALIHRSMATIPNVGLLVGAGEASVYHPGDSFAVPTDPVGVLLLPTSGPWWSLQEAADFAVAVRAPRAVQLHDALLSDTGAAVTERVLGGIIGAYGVALSHLAPGGSIEV